MHINQFDYFVLLADMRTGSNLFEQVITQYSDFSCYGELFNPAFIGGPNRQEFSYYSLTNREKDPLAFLNHVVTKDVSKLPGFRLFSNHDKRVTDHVLRDPRAAKIVLSRNPLESYVSLQIARKTQQWRIGDAWKHKSEKITFDLADFTLHLHGHIENQNHIRQVLQESGQTAFFLDYRDLNSPDTFNGLASYLGSSQRLEAINANIKRQNPVDLSEKIENFDEAVQQLRQLDYLGMANAVYSAPLPPVWLDNFHVNTASPVAFYELSPFGTNQLTETLQIGVANQPSWHRGETAIDCWRDKAGNKRLIALLAHPMEQAFYAYWAAVCSPQVTRNRRLRNMLSKHYGLSRVILENDNAVAQKKMMELAADPDAIRVDFKAFLQFVSFSLEGRTKIGIHPFWATQTSKARAFGEYQQIHEFVTAENLQTSLDQIAGELGLPPLQVEPPRWPDFPFDLAQVIDAELDEMIRSIYEKDFENFGFTDWSESRPAPKAQISA